MSFYVLTHSGFWDPQSTSNEQLADLKRSVLSKTHQSMDECDENLELEVHVVALATKTIGWQRGQLSLDFDRSDMWARLCEAAASEFLRTAKLPNATSHSYRFFVRKQSELLAAEYGELSAEHLLPSGGVVQSTSLLRQRRATRLELFLQSADKPFLRAKGLPLLYYPCWLVEHAISTPPEPNVIAELQVLRGGKVVQPEVY